MLSADPTCLRVSWQPFSRGIIIVGLEQRPADEITLPFDLAACGAAGCSLRVVPHLVIPVSTDAAGTTRIELPIAPATRYWAQAILIQHSESASRVVFSDVLQLGAEAQRRRESLPVFRLHRAQMIPQWRLDSILAVVTKSAGPLAAITTQHPRTSGRRAAAVEIEAYHASGGLMLRDTAKLWNPAMIPELPDEAQARAAADRFLAQTELLPAADGRTRVVFASHSETGIALDVPGPAFKILLDRQVNYEVRVAVDRDGRRVELPVVGGGGDFKVAVGAGADIIGYHGVWRAIAEVASEEEIISKPEAEAAFRASVRELDLVAVDASLAYYSAPAFAAQDLLAPVWVIRSVVKAHGRTMPGRIAIVPATKHALDHSVQPVAPLHGEGLLQPMVVRTAGSVWLGGDYGLPSSRANASGFTSGLAGAGWDIQFQQGDRNAVMAAWVSDDDNYVDDVDCVFYSGHADKDGWLLGSSEMEFSNVGTSPENPGDFYGGDLEWLIIGACGPHQSSHFRNSGTNSALTRWRGVFDGLHGFMGYGGVTFDTDAEGRRVIELARSGMAIIPAWFRTAWEIQPSTNGYASPDGNTIYVTAMWAESGDSQMLDDHLWGMGRTYPDARVPYQSRYFMYSGT